MTTNGKGEQTILRVTGREGGDGVHIAFDEGSLMLTTDMCGALLAGCARIMAERLTDDGDEKTLEQRLARIGGVFFHHLIERMPMEREPLLSVVPRSSDHEIGGDHA